MDQILNTRARLLKIVRKIKEPEEETERELRERRGRIDEQSSQAFDELIEEALKNDEIQKGANKAGVDDEFLRARLKERTSKIWEAAASETEAHNSLQKSYEARKREFGEPEEERSRQGTNARRLNVQAAILIISAIVIIVILVGELLSSLSATGSGLNSSLVLLGVGTATVVALYVFLFLRLRRALRASNDHLAEIEQHEQELSTLRERITSAGQALEKSVIETRGATPIYDSSVPGATSRLQPVSPKIPSSDSPAKLRR